MLEAAGVQPAAPVATLDMTALDTDLRQQWQAAMAAFDDETEPVCAPMAAPQDDTAQQPTTEAPQTSTAPVDPTATSLAVQRQLVQATAPVTAEPSWQLNLPAAWDVQVLQHTPTHAAPLWTLTLTPLQPAALPPDAAVLAGSLDRLQARLTRLPSPLNARVVLASEERSAIADRHAPVGPHRATPW